MREVRGRKVSVGEGERERYQVVCGGVKISGSVCVCVWGGGGER